jgi:hypothetical protein
MHDADVRKAVRGLLMAEHEGDLDTRVVEEMGVWNGAVRVDLAVINGELVGYELKSARDTLTRLANQAARYNEVFDRVYLVAATKHLDHAIAKVPLWWGIMQATLEGDEVCLDVIRPSGINPQIVPMQLARLLWREEALSVLEKHSAARGVRSGTREKLVVRLVETLGLDELRYEVRRCLKDREAWLGQSVGDQRHMAVGSEA